MPSDPVIIHSTTLEVTPVTEMLFCLLAFVLSLALAIRRCLPRFWVLFGATLVFAAKYVATFALTGRTFSGASGYRFIQTLHALPTVGFLLLSIYLALSLRSARLT